MYPVSIAESDRARLLRRLDKRLDRSGGPDACHPWRGALGKWGYGRIKVNGHEHNASRVIYALMVGDVPADLSVLHTCDYPACGNERHMFLGTHTDNMRDMTAKGRGTIPTNPTEHYARHVPVLHAGRDAYWDDVRAGNRVRADVSGDRNPMRQQPERVARGESAGGAKLTADQVREIRALAEHGVVQREIAARFGVSDRAVGKIVHRQTWAHI